MLLSSPLVVLLLAQSVAADLRIATWPKTGFKCGWTAPDAFNRGGQLCMERNSPDTSFPRTRYYQRRMGAMKGKNSRNLKLQLGWLEPSTFDYKGLGSFTQKGNPGPPGQKESLRAFKGHEQNKGQRNSNYDQFLRSNIDNEQDKRDFTNDAGQDHLPFRTWKQETYSSYHWTGTDLNMRRRRMKYAGRDETWRPGEGIVKGASVGLVAKVKPGESRMVPLRWNNPHAAELEVNIWIFEHSAGKQPIVVPIRMPTCSGEGHQVEVIKFVVPSDFADLGTKIPGFKGCNADSKPLCTVQIYAHSVESRTYSSGFPIVVEGHNSAFHTSSVDSIQAASKDPWLDLTVLRDLCLPSTDPGALIPNAVPRWARLVSDVYNHAYQNSDFSPYSGQQHESISQNLQASAINKMVTGNRGELGRSILPEETYKRIKQLKALENRIYRNYEALANKIIGDEARFPDALGNQMKTTAVIGTKTRKDGPVEDGDMMAVLAECFRCAETGSMHSYRQTTSTYIPSFQLPRSLIARAKGLVPAKYSDLITSSGQVRIYVQTLLDLLPFFYICQPYGIIYQEAMLKTTLGTKPDATQFQKLNGKGLFDEGVFASTLAKVEFASSLGCRQSCLYCHGQATKALIKGGNAKCARDKCANCNLLYTNWPQNPQSVPLLTPMADSIIKSGLPTLTFKDPRFKIVTFNDPDGSPRIGRGRPGAVPIPDQPQWKFATPAPTPTMPTSHPSTPSPSARRRRRRSKGSRTSRRRRGGGRRRRGSKNGAKANSQRRRRAELGLQQLFEEVGAQLQQSQAKSHGPVAK